ncbi:response regulator [Candidatus Parabeggiatoa sp. HSG14]|uniref:response regulator n=1 Tax=Candidatus Parabeggiatoa sp. HSG14 TaxID=3055593 RepID=UPI0025A75690|nr:response regulator [Thiotrichales bacterium HSG14]
MAHILIVDDSPQDVETIKTILEGQGHKISVAQDGESGIQRAQELHPDAVVMDIVMPGTDGFKATRKITKGADTKGIPVILLSSKNLESDRAWGLMSGGTEYLVKPVKPDELLDTVSKVLG